MLNAQLPDRIETLPCGAEIQHGMLNDRIYLMKQGVSLPGDLPETLIAKARKLGYSKIFAKVHGNAAEVLFLRLGYVAEGGYPWILQPRQRRILYGVFPYQAAQHRA